MKIQNISEQFHLRLSLIFLSQQSILRCGLPLRPELLKVLGNEARLRILLALARFLDRDLTVYKIAKFTGIDRKIVRRHLSFLTQTSFVKAKSFGTISVYNLNQENPYIQPLVNLFNEARLLVVEPYTPYWTEYRTPLPRTR